MRRFLLTGSSVKSYESVWPQALHHIPGNQLSPDFHYFKPLPASKWQLSFTEVSRQQGYNPCIRQMSQRRWANSFAAVSCVSLGSSLSWHVVNCGNVSFWMAALTAARNISVQLCVWNAAVLSVKAVRIKAENMSTSTFSLTCKCGIGILLTSSFLCGFLGFFCCHL